MSLVIDANLVAALVLPLPYSEQTVYKITAWKQSGTDLRAPLLLEYEVAAILRKAVVTGWLTTDVATEAMRKILNLNVQCVVPTPELHEQALRWAERLGHSKTYDAHYLALAEQLGSEFWTADQRLVNGAQQSGATWVYWIGKME
jgi:predicted nucleic acid-binding protein